MLITPATQIEPVLVYLIGPVSRRLDFWHKLPTNWLAGCLNHQQYLHQFTPLSLQNGESFQFHIWFPWFFLLRPPFHEIRGSVRLACLLARRATRDPGNGGKSQGHRTQVRGKSKKLEVRFFGQIWKEGEWAVFFLGGEEEWAFFWLELGAKYTIRSIEHPTEEHSPRNNRRLVKHDKISGKRNSNKVHGFWICQNSQDDQNLKKSALKNAVTQLDLTFENKALFCLIVVLDKLHLHFESNSDVERLFFSCCTTSVWIGLDDFWTDFWHESLVVHGTCHPHLWYPSYCSPIFMMSTENRKGPKTLYIRWSLEDRGNLFILAYILWTLYDFSMNFVWLLHPSYARWLVLGPARMTPPRRQCARCGWLFPMEDRYNLGPQGRPKVYVYRL